jgi:hypothetical protein
VSVRIAEPIVNRDPDDETTHDEDDVLCDCGSTEPIHDCPLGG